MLADSEEPLNEGEISRLISALRAAIGIQAWRLADQKAREVLKRKPNDPDALMYLGVARAAQGYEPEGEHHLLASLTFNPRNRDAYYHLGVIVLEQGRCILASEAFRKGISIDPENHQLHYQLGRALERLGYLDEALVAFKQALQNRPNPELDEIDYSIEADKSINRVKEAQRDSVEKTADCDD